jgi:hypothetical protein
MQLVSEPRRRRRRHCWALSQICEGVATLLAPAAAIPRTFATCLNTRRPGPGCVCFAGNPCYPSPAPTLPAVAALARFCHILWSNPPTPLPPMQPAPPRSVALSCSRSESTPTRWRPWGTATCGPCSTTWARQAVAHRGAGGEGDPAHGCVVHLNPALRRPFEPCTTPFLTPPTPHGASPRPITVPSPPPKKSDVVRVELPHASAAPASLSWAVRGVGDKAHGLVEYGEALLTLSSDEGALLALDPWTGEVAELWKVGGRPQRVMNHHAGRAAGMLLWCFTALTPFCMRRPACCLSWPSCHASSAAKTCPHTYGSLPHSC